MASSENGSINVDDWMNQQPVYCWQSLLACCNSMEVRRRYARQALFKRLTLDELERRYQKHQARLRPEEDQAVRQAVEKFEKGWYVNVQAKHTIGTFYSPVSMVLTSIIVIWTRLSTSPSFPFTTSIIKLLCMKDNPRVGLAYASIPFFPLLVSLDIIILLAVVPTVVLLLALLTILELPIFIGGLCYFGLKRLRTLGVFVYHCELYLIIAQGRASRVHGNVRHTVTLTKYDIGAQLTLPRASLCRTIFNNPIISIFKNLNWAEYSYGDIKNQYLSTHEVEMYGLRLQQGEEVYSLAISLA